MKSSLLSSLLSSDKMIKAFYVLVGGGLLIPSSLFASQSTEMVNRPGRPSIAAPIESDIGKRRPIPSTASPFDMSSLAEALPKISASHSAPTVADYDSGKEYCNHQEVTDRFFRRPTRNPRLRANIATFKDEIRRGVSVDKRTRINLDGVSSRSRILLFRELTALVQGRKETLGFTLNSKEFDIQLKPNSHQPGNGIVIALDTKGANTIGAYDEIVDILKTHTKDYQKAIAGKLRKARRLYQAQPRAYHCPMTDALLEDKNTGKKLDLEMLNVLLDFEVARRLQGEIKEEKNAHFFQQINWAQEYLDYVGDMLKEGEPAGDKELISEAESILQRAGDSAQAVHEFLDLRNKVLKVKPSTNFKQMFDQVPVGSAIAGFLRLAKIDSTPLWKYFYAPTVHTFTTKDGEIKQSGYNYGPLSVFDGPAKPDYRGKAAKEIIRRAGGGTSARNSTKEDIHQEYLETYGGASESEGESYNVSWSQRRRGLNKHHA